MTTNEVRKRISGLNKTTLVYKMITTYCDEIDKGNKKTAIKPVKGHLNGGRYSYNDKRNELEIVFRKLDIEFEQDNTSPKGGLLGSEYRIKGIRKSRQNVATKTEDVRPLSEIAKEIIKEWKNVNYAAKPYLDAMCSLNLITDNYMYDSAKSIVLYFLSNSSTWRGDAARRIKAELKKMVK